MKKQYDLIIFDMDGTLYPYTQEIDRAYPEAALELAAHVSGKTSAEIRDEFFQKKEELGKLLGGRPTYTLTLLHYYPVSVQQFVEAVDSRIKVEEILQPDPEVIRVLKQVSREYPLALYTTNNGRTAERILKTLKIDHFFPPESRLTLSSLPSLTKSRKELINYIKPGKKGFLHLINLHQVRINHTLMVGDSEVSDIMPAQSLGMDSYQIRTRQDFYQLPFWLGLNEKGETQ